MGMLPPKIASSLFQIEAAARVESCWPTIARARASQGSGRLPRRSISGWIGPCSSITRRSTLSARISSRSSALQAAASRLHLRSGAKRRA